jgi:hypothetical protein
MMQKLSACREEVVWFGFLCCIAVGGFRGAQTASYQSFNDIFDSICGPYQSSALGYG